MRWALKQSTNRLHYWNMEQVEFTAELKYNQQAQSFRLTAGDKRLFFIEKEMILLSIVNSIRSAHKFAGRL